MWLLDTNVLSELRGMVGTDALVATWADAIHPEDLYLSVITILEIEAGTLLAARKDAAKGAIQQAWIDRKVLAAFSGRILPIDVVVAQRCAAHHVPSPRSERNALIAATAKPATGPERKYCTPETCASRDVCFQILERTPSVSAKNALIPFPLGGRVLP